MPAILNTLKGQFPSLQDFEREFPSLCFALATGVGKTRLMGAFIIWRYLLIPHEQVTEDKRVIDFLQFEIRRA